MKVEKKLVKISNSLYLPINKDIQQHLGIKEDDKDNIIVVWQDEEDKLGKFISFWAK